MNDTPTMGDLAELLFATAVAQGRADALAAAAKKLAKELAEAEEAFKLQNVLTDEDYMAQYVARWKDDQSLSAGALE